MVFGYNFAKTTNHSTMKRNNVFTLFAFLLLAANIYAQERQIIQGYCKDENDKPIENVSVYVYAVFCLFPLPTPKVASLTDTPKKA